MNSYPTNLNGYLDSTVAKYPKNIALICDAKQFTYETIYQSVVHLSQLLVQRGVNKESRVVVFLDNSFDLVISFWAILRIGAIVSIVNTNTPSEKFNYILKDTLASHIITNQEFANRLKEFSEFLVLIDKVNSLIGECGLGVTDMDKSKSGNQRMVFDIDIAAIIYTSGSTGSPKGVAMSHHNMVIATYSILQYLCYDENDNVICALPLSFDYGLYQMIMSFAVGATLILEKHFVLPLKFLQNIEKYSVTVVPLVPSMVNVLYDFNKKFQFNLLSVKKMTNTGASLSIRHIETTKKLFSNALIFSMYGLTECKRCSYLPPQYLESKANSIGIAIPNTELWIIDEHNNRLGANKVGQLVIRGSNIMQGYWNNPELTKQKLKQYGQFGEKVLHTGDLCYLDNDGFLYYYGRVDEVIKSRGVKVSPKEVEDIILEIDKINEVAVFSIIDEVYGDKLFAAVVAVDEIHKSEIIKYCNSRLEKEKIPQQFLFLNSLPKTENGKVDKLKLQLDAQVG